MRWRPLSEARRGDNCLQCGAGIRSGDPHAWRPHAALTPRPQLDPANGWTERRLRQGGDSLCTVCGEHLLRLCSWNELLLGVIDDIGDALESRAHHRDFTASVAMALEGFTKGSRHWEMHRKWYRESQLLALRRAIDYDPAKPLTRRNHSLLRLLAEMAAHPATLDAEHLGFWLLEEKRTQAHVVASILEHHAVDRQWLTTTATGLRSQLEPIRRFVNQMVAHRAARPEDITLSYADLDAALDDIAVFVERCGLLLAVGVHMDQWDRVGGATWEDILAYVRSSGRGGPARNSEDS